MSQMALNKIRTNKRSARYVVDLKGIDGPSHVIEVGEDDDVDIAVAEQFTAYGDVEIDMVYPEAGTEYIERHGFDPEDYE